MTFGRPALAVLLTATLLTAVLAPGLTRLQFSTGQDTLLSPDSDVYQDNRRYQESFGGDPVIVLLQGEVLSLWDEPNRSQIEAFEREMAGMHGVHSIVSPLTLVTLGVTQAQAQQAAAVAELARLQAEAADQARRGAELAGETPESVQAAVAAAEAAALAAFLEARAADLERFQAIGEVSAANRRFAEFVLFDDGGRPRAEVRGLVPDSRHALIIVRLAGNLPFDEQSAVAARVRHLALALELSGFEVLPSGPALLIKEINDSMRSTLVLLGGVSALVMAAVLALVFRARWRLVSLPVVLAACIWLFGGLGHVGFPLTLVTISALPILLGLGVDFAVQVHNRIEERWHEAPVKAALGIVPTLLVALAAAIAGFAALLLSDVPMIRDFSLMLALGAAAVMLGSLVLMPAALSLRQLAGRQARAWTAIPVEEALQALTQRTRGRTLPLLAIGLLAITFGVWADQRLGIETDPERFVSSESVVLKELRAIRSVTGSTSELGLLVEAPDVLDPAVLAWMAAFSERQLASHPQLRSGSSAASLIAGALGRLPRDSSEAREVIATAPDGLRRTLVSDDGRQANVVFSIGEMSLEERQALVRSVRSTLDAPLGVSVSPGGVAVIGAATVEALSSGRTTMSLVALAGVFLVLLAARRSVVLAATVVLPVVLALGVSASLLYAAGIHLNPLTAVSGPLVIAMGTEFGVLIAWRYRDERRLGHAPHQAIETTMRQIGRAVLASGLTVIAGFSALIFSDFPLLGDFGLVTSLNLAVSLVSVVVLLPGLLLWLDRESEAERDPAGAASRV